MNNRAEIYNEVAERCSSYECSKKCGCHTNSSDEKSCLNCKHFADEEYCRLDLYDRIVDKINS